MRGTAFLKLVEDSDAFKLLKQDVLNKSVSQCYVFSSPDKLFTSLLSKLFVSFALFNENGFDVSEAVFDGVHADVYVASGKKDVILTEDITELLSKVYIKPSMGNKRFFVIENGSTMNATCQNKLLKTLEEPPSTAFFIIIATSLSSLLPTIISRCKKIEPSFVELDKLMKAVEIDYPQCQNKEEATVASNGNLLMCSQIVSNNKFAQIYKSALESVLFLESSKNVLKASFKLIAYKEYAEEFLSYLELVFRDIIAVHSGQDNLIMLKYIQNEILTLSKRFSLDATVNIMSQIIRAKKRLKGYGNINSIADELFFSIAELKAKYQKQGVTKK